MMKTVLFLVAVGACIAHGLARADDSNDSNERNDSVTRLAQAGTNVKPPAAPAPSKGAKVISEDEAKKIALKAVPGKVQDIAIEKKLGADRYVVEVIPAKGGKEVDVVIHMTTGKVLAIEN